MLNRCNCVGYFPPNQQVTALLAAAAAAAAHVQASTATATEPATTKYASAVGCAKLFIESGADTLNLAGLLNVLDGVVDTPGRLLVLSTNHPEVLDPALIRPGRINRCGSVGEGDCNWGVWQPGSSSTAVVELMTACMVLFLQWRFSGYACIRQSCTLVNTSRIARRVVATNHFVPALDAVCLTSSLRLGPTTSCPCPVHTPVPAPVLSFTPAGRSTWATLPFVRQCN